MIRAIDARGWMGPGGGGTRRMRVIEGLGTRLAFPSYAHSLPFRVIPCEGMKGEGAIMKVIECWRPHTPRLSPPTQSLPSFSFSRS